VPQADVGRDVAAGLQARGLPVPFVLHPVVSQGRVFVQTTRWVAALDRRTGVVLWRYPRAPSAPTSRRVRDAVLAPAVWRGRVYAFVGGAVVALSAARGTVAWRASGLIEQAPRPREGEGGGPPPPELLVNSPVVAAGKVFVSASAVKQETESLVIALDARSGAVLWRLKLCSQVFRGYLGRGSHPAPPAFDEGTVYVSSNLGAVAAVCAETGAVRWLAEYDSFRPARRRVALRTDDCWENGPPVVYRGLVIAAPQDCDDLIALDADTGRERWRTPRRGLRYLAGTADGRVYVTGNRAAAVDVSTGKVLWFSTQIGRPAGRPALLRSALLIPTESAIVELDTRSGKVISQYRLDHARERGNLVVAGKLLLAASFDRVDAYGDAADIMRGGSPADRLARGQRLDRLGDAAGALREYKLALHALENDGGARPALRPPVLSAISKAQLRLGRSLAAAGHYGEAAKSFLLARRYAASSRASVEATFALAECRERQGKWKQAVAAYQFAVQRQRGAPVEVLRGVSLPAELVAASRVDRIISKQGREVYREQDLKAAGLLEAARKDKAPALFAAVEADYPNSVHAAAARRERLKLPGARRNEKLTLAWRTPLDTARSSPRIIPGVPVASAGKEPLVLIATRDRGNPQAFLWDAVECRRVRDGTPVWRAQVGPHLARGHLTDGRLILRGVSRFTALDVQTGRVVWATADAPAGGPWALPGVGAAAESKRIIDSAAGAGRVFAATAAKEVFAIDVASGKEAWRRKLKEAVLPGSLRLSGRRLVVCGENPGTVYWFDPAKGRQLGKVRLDRRDSRLTDAPAFQTRRGRLCLVLGDREVRNVRLDTGATLWKSEMPFSIGRVSASPDGGRVVVFPDRWSFGGKVTCFDAATGKLVWRRKPQTKEPGGVYVGDDLIVSANRTLFADVLTAQRLGDGVVVWTRPLAIKPVVETLTDAGEFLIASGSSMGMAGWRGYAAIVRKSDGTTVATMTRRGAGYSSIGRVADTFLLCSDRGIEAHRMGTEGASAKRLAALLDAENGPTADDALSETARLLLARGEYGAAVSLLDEALLAEQPRPQTFARLHEQLMAIREAAAEHRRATYEAPLLRRAPKIDGRLCEDWRADRAARLDKPHNIERLQFPLSPPRFWRGPNDLSAAMYVAWDAKNLYLAVDVNDDIQTTHDFDAPDWEGDGLMVAIDPEGDGGYRLHGRDTVFWLALTAKQKKPRDEEDRLGGEHSIKVKEDESGTIYELSVPWSDVGIDQPRAGLRLGLNIMVFDDDGAPNLKGVTWTPGLTQNKRRDMIGSRVAPALFGTVILKER